MALPASEPALIAPMPPRDWAARLAAIWLAVLAAAALFAPLLPLADPNEGDLLAVLAAPDGSHWFGTDSLGRDVFARAIYGARISAAVGLGSVAIGLLLGGALGLAAGHLGGWWDRLISGGMTVLLSFPALILAIAIVSGLGQKLPNVIVAIGILFVPAFARLVRANTLVFRGREFVLAAEISGAGTLRVLLREIVPNLMPAVLSYALLMVGVAVLAEGALGFLGLSVRPPLPSWGGMIAAERGSLREAPYAVFLPALVMFLSVTALNVLGERARRLFDVKAAAL